MTRSFVNHQGKFIIFYKIIITVKFKKKLVSFHDISWRIFKNLMVFQQRLTNKKELGLLTYFDFKSGNIRREFWKSSNLTLVYWRELAIKNIVNVSGFLRFHSALSNDGKS